MGRHEGEGCGENDAEWRHPQRCLLIDMLKDAEQFLSSLCMSVIISLCDLSDDDGRLLTGLRWLLGKVEQHTASGADAVALVRRRQHVHHALLHAVDDRTVTVALVVVLQTGGKERNIEKKKKELKKKGQAWME